jgi:hypothetical protein
VDRALPTVGLLQLLGETPQSWPPAQAAICAAGPCRNRRPHRLPPARCWSGRHGGGRRPDRPGPASSAASAAIRPALLRPGGWSPQPSATAGRSQPETQAGTADECMARGLLSGGTGRPQRQGVHQSGSTPGPIATAKSGHASGEWAAPRPPRQWTTSARLGCGRSRSTSAASSRLGPHRPELGLPLRPAREVPPQHDLWSVLVTAGVRRRARAGHGAPRPRRRGRHR